MKTMKKMFLEYIYNETIILESDPGPYVVLRIEGRGQSDHKGYGHRIGPERNPYQQREPDGGHDEDGSQSMVWPGEIQSDFKPNPDGTIRR